MWERILIEIMSNHRGKLFGILGGLLFAIFVLLIGFLQTLFIVCCIIVGYIIGKRIDDNEGLRELIEQFFKDR